MSTRQNDKARNMKLEEAADLDPDETGGEIVDGEWKPVTRNTWNHARILVRIVVILDRYCASQDSLDVYAGDPGAKLAEAPEARLRGPDVAVLARDRFPEGKGVAGWLEGAPELAVEIAGDSQSAANLLKKAYEYLEAGGQQVWIVDPAEESVLIVTPPNRVDVLSADDELSGLDVLPGFSCKVADFFS